MLILSADIVLQDDGWEASLAEHNPANRSKTVDVWLKTGMRSGHNAEIAMEAAYQKLQRAGVSKFPVPTEER